MKIFFELLRNFLEFFQVWPIIQTSKRSGLGPSLRMFFEFFGKGFSPAMFVLKNKPLNHKLANSEP